MTPDEIATRTRDAILHAEHSARRTPAQTPVVVMMTENLRALLDECDALKARVAELEKEPQNKEIEI